MKIHETGLLKRGETFYMENVKERNNWGRVLLKWILENIVLNGFFWPRIG
jgi:hypothetical protein